MNYNNYTGRNERQWLMYGDDTIEPVRRDQSVSKKYNADKRTVDWFVMQKPKDWDPVKEGYNVSLNHDYGQENKPGGPPKARPLTPERNQREDKVGPFIGQMRELNTLKEGHKKLPMMHQTTLGRGPAAYTEYEAQRKTRKTQTRNSANDARQMEGLYGEIETKEYNQWLDTMRNNPPWAKERTPAEKVQGVTEPLGEQTAGAIIETLLKNNGTHWGKNLSRGLSRLGIAADIFGNADEAW